MGLSSFLIHRLFLVQRLTQTPSTAIRPPSSKGVGIGKRCSECDCGVVFIPYSPALVSSGPASDSNSNTAIRPPSSKGVGTAYRNAMLGAWLWGCLQSVPCPSMATDPPLKGPARVIKLGAGNVGGSKRGADALSSTASVTVLMLLCSSFTGWLLYLPVQRLTTTTPPSLPGLDWSGSV